MKNGLLVMDCDETLLKNDGTISEKVKEYIKKAVDANWVVTVATGRMFVATLPLIKELGLSVDLINYQGALVKNSETGETLYQKPVPMQYAKEIIRYCDEHNVHSNIYINGNYYIKEHNEYSEDYHRRQKLRGIAVDNLEEVLTEEPYKILIISEPERIQEVQKHLKAKYGDDLQISISRPMYLEINHKDTSKGAAIKFLMEKYDIPLEKVIAVGDSYNDVSMIQYAGTGVAMGNAYDDIKAKADLVAPGNEEDGVAWVIQELILKD